MSWLHRLLQLQRQRSQEAIPDGPQEPDASAPDAPDLTSVGAAPAAAAPARPISGLAAPYHPRLYNNTYQADANALLEQLETTAPAALPRVQAPMLPFEPSSRSPGSSESKHARSTSRDISPVSERTPLLQPASPPLHPGVSPHTLTSPATPSEPGFRVTLSPMLQPTPATAMRPGLGVVPHHTTQLQPTQEDSSDENEDNGDDSSDDDDDDDEEAMSVHAHAERKSATDEAAVQAEKAAVVTGLSPSALSPSPSPQAHPLQETEKAQLHRMAEQTQRHMHRHPEPIEHQATPSHSSEGFCIFVWATKWMLVVAAMVFIAVALFFYFRDPNTSHAHMRHTRDNEHAAMSKHHKGIPTWPSRPQPKRRRTETPEEKHEEQHREPLQAQENAEVTPGDERLKSQSSALADPKAARTPISRLRLRLPLRTRG